MMILTALVMREQGLEVEDQDQEQEQEQDQHRDPRFKATIAPSKAQVLP